MTVYQDLAPRLRSTLRGTVDVDCPLATYTTYRIGGPADLVLVPADLDDLVQALLLLEEEGVPWEVLGGGSNVLVSDRGVRGAVVLTSGLDQLTVEGAEITAGAGIPSHEVALAARRVALTGAEFLAWLPGSFGGACLMNARAYGGEISRVLTRARVVTRQGQLRDPSLRPEQFDYKRSPFQGTDEIVVEATLSLAPGDPEAIQRQMDQNEASRRANHEMDHPSCGCVFKNDHRIGISSGELIDDCGLKGYRVGQAQVSSHHANFVINLGQATAAQVYQVIEHVRRTVAEQTGHQLELEVRLMGEWD
jgi:UDP-N-acetylmuramate dehydrogenase